MQYRIEPFTVDLGETAIENIFLNQYLKIAPSNALRVYLYAYKEAKGSSLTDLSDESLGKDLGLLEEEVREAWQYWIEQGIVRLYPDRNLLEFISLRQLMLGYSDLFKGVKEPGKTESSGEEPFLTETWLPYYQRIEEVLGVPLHPGEIQRLEEFREEYQVSREIITRGFEYLQEKGGPRNVNYVLGAVRCWIIDGVKTEEDLEEKLTKEKKLKELRKNRRNYRKNQRYVTKDERGRKEDLDALMNRGLTGGENDS